MEPKKDQNKNTLLLIYCLYGAAIFAGVTALVGLVMLYIKRKDFEAEGYLEHYHWLTNTFWITLGLGAVAVVTTPFFGIGIIVGVAAGIYYLWRVLKGGLCLKDGKPIEMPTQQKQKVTM